MRWTLLISAIFLIPLVSATPVLNLQHQDITAGETILATITTTEEFTKEIVSSDIKFLEGRRETFFESDITFYNNTYYLYAYTTRPGNFILKIPNILYKESGILKSVTLEKNFEIKQPTNESNILSIKPGFIKPNDKQKIKLTNKGNSPLTIKYEKNKTTLNKSSSKEIKIIPESTFYLLEISTYKTFNIPIISNKINTIPPKEFLDLKTNPEFFVGHLYTKEENKEFIELFNFADENLTNISITSDIPFLKIENMKNLSARNSYNLSLIFSPEKPGYKEGTMNITYFQNNKEKTFIVRLALYIVPKGSNETEFEISEQTCEEKGGSVCSSEEVCDGQTSFTKDREYCCIGNCVPSEKNKEESGGYGWLIGLIIILVLGFIGYIIYKRSKKISSKKPDEILKEKSDAYSKRIKGSLQRS